MGVQTRQITVDEFERLAALPENVDRRLEYIGGEISEMVTNSDSSLIAANLLFFIQAYLRENGQWAYVTGEGGGYSVAGERYIPDVGVIAKTRQTEPPHETWIAHAPDLAVEVLSPTDRPHEVSVKIVNYLSAGTTVWLVDPERRVIKICVPGQRVKTVGGEGILDGGTALPGFHLAVKDIFEV